MAGNSYDVTIERPRVYNSRTAFVDLWGFFRSFSDVTSTPKPREITQPALVTPEAYARWGQPSDFGIGDAVRARFRGVTVDPDDDDPDKRVRIVWSEEARGWKDFRAENPDDPDEYAIYRGTTEIALTSPDGSQIIFQMSPTSYTTDPQAAQGSGQTPPAPPELDQIGETPNTDPFKPFDPFE